MPAIASAFTTAPPPEPWLIVSRRAISFGDGAPIVRLDGDSRVQVEDRPGGEVGVMIGRFFDRLVSVPVPAHPTGVAIDPEVPYSTVMDVVMNLHMLERRDLAFLVRRREAIGALPARWREPYEMDQLPRLRELTARGAAPDVEAASSYLYVNVTEQGIVVVTRGAILLPGCAEVDTGNVVTVPTRNGGQDFDGLRACLAQVDPEHRSEYLLIVSAEPETPFRDVAGAIAVTRGTAGQPLFERAALAGGG